MGKMSEPNEIRRNGFGECYLLKSIEGTKLVIESMSTGEKDIKTLSEWQSWTFVGKQEALF